MWFADQFRIEMLRQEKAYENTIATNIMKKYGVLYSDLTPLILDDNDRWVKLDIEAGRLERRTTDDGCEHYQHKDGRFFVLQYHFENSEWKEVSGDMYKPVVKNSQKSLFERLRNLFIFENIK